MCGIAGILNLQSGAPVRTQVLDAMLDSLESRGPDGRGTYLEEPDQLGLAHARLSIIDLAGGAQPIHNEDRSVWVVFNGEIFNYVELRAELEKAGHRFYTHTDTEVIVHLYEEHGLKFVDQLNGQFAIALWDKPRRRPRSTAPRCAGRGVRSGRPYKLRFQKSIIVVNRCTRALRSAIPCLRIG